ncbi:SUKH-3 domain-containing protein [Paenibacillus sp. CAU 1782]
MDLAETTKQMLIQAGWEPGERVDIDHAVRFLEGMGYEVPEAVKEALSRFGGKIFEVTHPEGHMERFHFCPDIAAGDYYEKEDFEEFEDLVKESLLIIGEAYREHVILLISESGKIYGKNGGSLSKLGDTIFDALDTFCLFKSTEEVSGR